MSGIAKITAAGGLAQFACLARLPCGPLLLRDPLLKLVCGRLPSSDPDLAKMRVALAFSRKLISRAANPPHQSGHHPCPR